MIKFENKANGRFYYVEVKRDLLGDLVININRGGSSYAIQRIVFCGDARSIRAKIREIIQRRTAKGYCLVR